MTNLRKLVILALLGYALWNMPTTDVPVPLPPSEIETPVQPPPGAEAAIVTFYYMDRCPPCDFAKPHVERMEREGVKFERVKVRNRSSGVSQVPTFVVDNFETHDVFALERHLKSSRPE